MFVGPAVQVERTTVMFADRLEVPVLDHRSNGPVHRRGTDSRLRLADTRHQGVDAERAGDGVRRTCDRLALGAPACGTVGAVEKIAFRR